ncbi:MAG: NADH-quinone oxidoreductase subunit J [Actinobacteria bacterium]|nr:NADH-quinone oxidoreductase subunit J [Actinomycetota bacterium]
MGVIFYISAAVAVAATVGVITSDNAVHALLYLIVSLLAISLIFYILGAPFAAALEAIIYAGAIMVLFIFVIMILNLGPQEARRERSWLKPRMWVGPAALALILAGELVYLLLESGQAGAPAGTASVGPEPVGATLFGPYLLGVELASFLLLAGLVGALHLGRRETGEEAAGEQEAEAGAARAGGAAGAAVEGE